MPAFEYGEGMEILTQSTNTEGHEKARKTLSPLILKGRPTLLYQSEKMNAAFDWEESFSMPGCSAALHIRDCCGWEQGELITLLFEAWTALLCCASFKNDKHLSKEHSFVLWCGSFAHLNHRRLLNLFCFLHIWPALEPGHHCSLFRLTEQFCTILGRDTGLRTVLATKRCGVTVLSTVLGWGCCHQGTPQPHSPNKALPNVNPSPNHLLLDFAFVES